MSADPSERRQRLAPGTEVGIDEAMIARLVQAFYAKVRTDPVLGPVFNPVIGDGWEAHLAKLCDFWSSVMLMSGRFKGAPMAVHMALPQISPSHFTHWLDLFGRTADEVRPPAAAALFRAKAETIARSLQLGISLQRDGLSALMSN